MLILEDSNPPSQIATMLYIAQKIKTKNHQFCLPHCGVKPQPTYVSAHTCITNYHWWAKNNSLTQTVQSKAAAMLHTIL